MAGARRQDASTAGTSRAHLNRAMPHIDIVTGPSGAGKSTFVSFQQDWTNVWNLDDLERSSGNRDAALRRMDRGIRDDLQHRRPLVIDHIVDSEALEQWIEPARKAGYSMHAWLLSGDNPRIHVRRVRQRRAEGGHGAPDQVVRALHDQALGSFGALTLLCDRTFLIDSSSKRPALVSSIARFEYARLGDKRPRWAEELTSGLVETKSVSNVSEVHRRLDTGWGP